MRTMEWMDVYGRMQGSVGTNETSLPMSEYSVSCEWLFVFLLKGVKGLP